MSTIQNTIKQIQDIMWQDAGVNGDAIRLEQLVWMIFLKIFDDREKALEFEDDNYISPIPEELRYRAWAANDAGITGDALLSFVDGTLFPALKNLTISDARASIVKNIMSDTNNYMKNGTLMRQVFNKINQINFNQGDNRHGFGDLYETLLKSLQSAGTAGEFYTPRPLTKFVTDMVDPKLGERILDPACGTGGFLVNAIDHIRPDIHTTEDMKKLADNLQGFEFKPLPHMLAITNLMLHGVERPDIVRLDDTLSHPYIDWTPDKRVDVILANPPFGARVVDGTELNFPVQFRTKDTADLFLVLMIKLLNTGGRAGIVLPDGSLFGEGVKATIKEHLLTECNLHTIVRLPAGVFNPYAGVNTNLLFFTRGVPTTEVWYYQMKLPTGLRAYTKTKPMQDHEFDDVRAWWNNRTENEHAWRVSIDTIRDRGWNLDIKNPHVGEVAEVLSSKQLVEKLTVTQKEIDAILLDLNTL
jgi:type I restriction enzyme M protein